VLTAADSGKPLHDGAADLPHTSLIASKTPGLVGGSARSVQQHFACDPLMSPKTK
jgi:hypothetical protein